MRHYTGSECPGLCRPRASKSSYATGHGLRTVLSHAARRGVERAGRLRLGLEQMLAAEALGYHSVWIAEHHFNDYGLCPAPPVLASFLAARTRTLRLGMGVSLLPLHHPVDLAEQLAVLDVVSGGRLDVGIGRGGTLQDYQTFQSDREDSRARVEEGIALIQQCWRGAAVRLPGALPLGRAAPRAAAARAAAAPAAVHRRQQRGQRALGRAPGPAHAVVVLRADRRAAAAPRGLSRGGARGRAAR